MSLLMSRRGATAAPGTTGAQGTTGAPGMTAPGATVIARRKVAARCAATVALGLLAAACGSTAAPGASSGGSATAGANTTAAAKVSLDVVISGSATTPAAHYTLRCDPDGGSVADPAAACAKLIKGTSLFGSLPGRVACPMILASAGRATVTGTYLGRHVHETIVDGGCDLARWAKLRQIFN